MLMTTMFLGAFSVAAPEPVHAAAYTYYLDFKITQGRTADITDITVTTNEGEQSAYAQHVKEWSGSFDVDSTPTKVFVNGTGFNTTLQTINTNDQWESGQYGNTEYQYKTKLVANIVNDASYNATTSFTYNGSQKTAVTNVKNATVSGTNSATDVGNYTATVTPNSGHAWSDGTTSAKTVSWKITQATNSWTTAAVKQDNWTYNGSSKSLFKTKPVSKFGSVQYRYKKDSGSYSSYSTTVPSATNAGTYYVDYKVDGTTNYTGLSVSSFTVTVSKAGITPTVNLDGWTYGSPNNPSVSGNTGSGTVTYTYYTDAACTKQTTTADGASSNGGKPLYVGTYYVKATVAATANYNGETSVAKSFTISKKTATLTWSNTSFTYDGQPHKPSASVSNLVSGDTCDVTVGGAQTNAGDHTATATALSNSNYALPSTPTKDFTINKKPYRPGS